MKFFRPHEFECKCGKCGLGFAQMDEDALERLDTARLYSDYPYRINRAVSCESHNEQVGGLEKSSHLAKPKCTAFDIDTPNSHARFKVLYGLIKAGFNRIGVYKTFIHADADKSKAPEVVWYGG